MSTEDTVDAVSKALRSAWQLGQRYWQQADSDSYADHARSHETQRKFEVLVDETRASLARDLAGPTQEGLRRLVDVVWQHATEGQGGWPSTETSDALITKALGANGKP